MRKRLILALLVAFASVSLLAVGQVTVWTETHVTETKQDAVIDWTEGWILATGMAIPPPDSISEAHGKLNAREGAIHVARQRLAEIIKGVNILAVASVRDLILEEAVLEVIVEAEAVKGQIVPALEEWIVPKKRFLFFFWREGDWKEGEYHVTIQYNFLRELPLTMAPYAIEPTERPSPEDFETTPFSGLVINALGTPLRTAVLLRLVDPDEKEVAVIRGPGYAPSVGYQLSLGQISVDRAERDPRVGEHPLTVQVQGIAEDGHSLVISQTSADLIRQMVATSDILEAYSNNVVVVVSEIRR